MQIKSRIAYLSKTLILAFNLLMLTSETTLNQTLSRNYFYPIVNNSNNDKPFCYMETQDATVLDLSSLCRRTSIQKDLKEEKLRRLCNNLKPEQMGDLRVRRRCVG